MSKTRTVHITGTEQRFTVEEGQTVLDAGLRAGVALPHACKSGACGSCRSTLVEGEAEYEVLGEREPAGESLLLCRALPLTDLEISVPVTPGTSAASVFPARVEKVAALAPEVIGITLKPAPGSAFSFRAGQYVNILMKDGRRRAFSLANAPHSDGLLEMHIRKVAGGEFTAWVFEELREKTLLRLEGPLGDFTRRESVRPMLLVGGGTGFAPLKAIIEEAWGLGETRTIHLVRGARNRADLYLDALPAGWAAEQPTQFRYLPVLSAAEPEDAWRGATGLVHETVLAEYRDLGDWDIYIAGPPAMVEAARRAFLLHGARGDRVFHDPFDFSPERRPRPAP